MSPDDKTPAEEPTGASPAAEAPVEDAPTSEAGRSEEPVAAAEPETTRPASAADATSADDVDDEPETAVADADTDDDAPAAEKAKRARRPRRKATEPEAEEAPAKPSQPAPTRRRSRREPGEPAPVVRAQAKYVRSSARKARLVCDHIRGKSVEEARAILALTPRAIASDWSKLLESAVANAEHNHELVGEDLYVKAVHADEGPTIKRFRPRAMGRATQIRKRTSHLTILLTQKD
jgi:ribosomal protein L22